eukprot:TRINITY_DN31708_c0_g1_i1.p1 TRINITY_DN31708_c0_g1~~TRINITY_DN31708_c0_g1_i1.p1  ORF type:complete len:158 (+),score=24.07 TRINITY_DN31708_c0_g1_i1:164-637(+)
MGSENFSMKLSGTYAETVSNLRSIMLRESFSLDTMSRKSGQKLGLGTGATAGSAGVVRRAMAAPSPVDLSFLDRYTQQQPSSPSMPSSALQVAGAATAASTQGVKRNFSGGLNWATPLQERGAFAQQGGLQLATRGLERTSSHPSLSSSRKGSHAHL